MEGGPPSFPPGFTCPVVLWILTNSFIFRLRDYHPLWLAFPYHSARFYYRCVSPQPRRINPPVWPLPRSLATTSGISVDFSSSPYLDVSVQAVPHVRLFDSTQADRVLLCRVSPFGNLRVKAYVQLTAAYRSLSRPSSAPDAKAFPLRSFQLDLLVAKSAWLRFRFRENFARSPAPRFSPKTGFRRGGTGYEFCSELSENSWFSLRIMQALQRSKLYVTLHPFGCCSTINLLRHAFT